MEVGRQRCRCCVSDHTGVQSIGASGSRRGGTTLYGMALRVDACRVVELGVAEQLHVVGMDCRVFCGELGESPAQPDFVTGAGARIALDRFAQRADPGLFRGAALTGALAAQAAPERTQAPAAHGRVAAGPVDVQPGVALVRGARQPGHDPADRAHQVAVLRQGDLRRHGARAPAVAMRFGARFETQRSRRPIRPIERRLTTGAALRPAADRVP